jgi:hypothetical protein
LLNTADSTVTLTLLPGVTALAERVFEIVYDVKDNGIPASQYAAATLSIRVADKPDNISEADGYVTQPAQTWSFKESMTSESLGVLVDNSCIPLVGNVDNDGKTEIIVFGKGFAGAQAVDSIYIFEVDADNTLRMQQEMKVVSINRVNNPYAIARVDGNEYAALFFCTSHYKDEMGNTNGADSKHLMKYVYNPATQQYEFAWKQEYSSRADRAMGQPVIVDFNGDGVAEVLVLDKVFNAQTGALLADDSNGFGLGRHILTTKRWVPGAVITWSAIMAVGDIYSDGRPEAVGKNSVYKVAINNATVQDGSNTFTLLRKVSTAGHPEAVYGATAIADIDLDGMLDVVVSGNLLSGSKSSPYIWNPRTGEVMHSNVVDTIPAVWVTSINKREHSASVPFLGDIDGDGIPEICLTGYRVTKAFEFDASVGSLAQKWSIATNDGSSATTGNKWEPSRKV